MPSAWGMRRAGFGVSVRWTDRELRRQALELEIREQGLGRGGMSSNAKLPIATPGLYRLLFSTKWAGCEGKGRTLDEVYAMDPANQGGAKAILEVFGWAKLEQVQPGATAYFDEFINGNTERRAIFEKLMKEKRTAQASVFRRGGRRGPTHAEREKQREFGF